MTNRSNVALQPLYAFIEEHEKSSTAQAKPPTIWVSNREQQLSFVHCARQLLNAPTLPSTEITGLDTSQVQQFQAFLWKLFLTLLYCRINLHWVPFKANFIVDPLTGLLKVTGNEKHRVLHVLALPHQNLAGVPPLVFSGVSPQTCFRVSRFMVELNNSFDVVPGENLMHAALQLLEVTAMLGSLDVGYWFDAHFQGYPQALEVSIH